MFIAILAPVSKKNKAVLISDYKTRIDNNNNLNAKEESIVADTVVVIDAYVEKMRNSGNTNITYEYILDNVHEKNLVDSFYFDNHFLYLPICFRNKYQKKY